MLSLTRHDEKCAKLAGVQPIAACGKQEENSSCALSLPRRVGGKPIFMRTILNLLLLVVVVAVAVVVGVIVVAVVVGESCFFFSKCCPHHISFFRRKMTLAIDWALK